ncbi:hypothetical protein MBAV_003706 [Candidatus Magnetobacterium bavaricum]|uniref:Uncharacterized protein n=1 Tax=Candidatus Magnetobacterium bavaricum TaxID=29290 RepID=A0A0F3GQ89_9BACT|nr:hypothetical protein MBAV_003706 [Candidatus Magnetobacterium bavaricum]
MAEQKLGVYQKEILAKLREAGGKGLSKSGLGIGPKGTSKAKALKDLEEKREVVNLKSCEGKSKTALYVLGEFNFIDKVCGFVEKLFAEKGVILPFSEKQIKDIQKGVKGATVIQVKLALTWLLNEALRGRHGAVAAGTGTPAPLERERVLAAYERVKERCGFVDVEIADLREELSVSQQQLEAFLLQESRHENAVLSQGDWSLSDEKTHSGAINLFGKPHLLVRFITINIGGS